jgi:type IV pilus assembly protein PilF
LRIEKIVAFLLLLGLLQACVTAGPTKSQNEKASAVNVQLGIGYLQQNNLELASEKLDKALRQDPNSAAAHNAYAILQDRLQQAEKAEYHYKRATTLDPRDSQANNNYGAFLCRNNRERGRRSTSCAHSIIRSIIRPSLPIPTRRYACSR